MTGSSSDVAMLACAAASPRGSSDGFVSPLTASAAAMAGSETKPWMAGCKPLLPAFVKHLGDVSRNLRFATANPRGPGHLLPPLSEHRTPHHAMGREAQPDRKIDRQTNGPRFPVCLRVSGVPSKGSSARRSDSRGSVASVGGESCEPGGGRCATLENQFLPARLDWQKE